MTAAQPQHEATSGVDEAAVHVVAALAAHGVEALVLRGPAINNRLCGGRRTRTSDDVDLLVESVEAGEVALVATAARRVFPDLLENDHAPRSSSCAEPCF